MKLWKIMLATMIALVLVCAVAMADETKLCENGCASFSEWKQKTDATCATGSYWEQYKCNVSTCPNNKVVVNTKYADDKLPHTWDETKTVVVNPTCTEGGSTTKYCTVCKQSYVVNKTDKLGHAKKFELSMSLLPTCDKAGYNFYQCDNRCGYTWTEPVAATGYHTWINYDEEKPTCSADGHTAYRVCDVCGKTELYQTLAKDPDAHVGQWYYNLSKDPTCQEAGYIFYQCNICMTSWTEPVKKVDHNWVQKEYKPATCSQEGHTIYYECSMCKTAKDKTVIPATGNHAWNVVDSLSLAATCTKDGYVFQQCDCGATKTTVVNKIGHDWDEIGEQKPTCVADGYTAHLKCSVCKTTHLKETIPATGKHNMVEVPQGYVAPTCLKEGQKVEQCSVCGESKTTVLKKADHSFTVTVTGKAPVCGSDGYSDHLACAQEGCKATQGKVVIPAAGAHKWEKTSTVAATCTKEGWEVWTCSVKGCGATEKRNEVAKLGHDVTLLVSNKLPTCTAEGEEVYTCSRCKDDTTNKTVKVAKLAHNYVEAGWSERVAATCTSEGLAYRNCTYCGGAEQVKTLAALGHKMAKDPVVVLAATCEKDGEAIKVCERCTLRETIVLPAKGHTKADNVIAEADCYNVGMKHVYCKVCDKILEKNVIIPATNHKNAKITVTKEATCTAEGERTVDCPTCGKKTEKIAKLDHKYSWVEISKPSPAGSGKSEYKCSACGHVAETKTVKYSKYYYNNTMTSFGPMTKELVGGNDWYRVTPVDLSVDGVYTYDLIASNKYVVGKVTIAVNAGALTVSYKTNNKVEVTDESLLIYASKADLAAGTAVTAPVGAAINATETFGADNNVLVSLVLTGNYDAAGKDLIDTTAAAGMIANID